MNPLTTLELETCTLAELIVLAKVIEALLSTDGESAEERQSTFVNRVLVRREMKTRVAKER